VLIIRAYSPYQPRCFSTGNYHALRNKSYMRSVSGNQQRKDNEQKYIMNETIMKNLFLVIVLLLSTNAYSQIKIMSTEVQKPKYDNFVYDSLRNMSSEKYEDKYTYHHLIGQTLLYCGDPYSYGTRSNFKVGNYYKVDGILPDDIGKGLYHRLSLTNINTGEKGEEGDIFTEKYNFKWIVFRTL
jgi:hypothetical protein